jgi:hypothetical protein
MFNSSSIVALAGNVLRVYVANYQNALTNNNTCNITANKIKLLKTNNFSL